MKVIPRKQGVGVRPQALYFLLFTVFVMPATAQQNNPAPVTCTQFIAWTAGEVSSQRLNRLARERGIAFSLDSATSETLLAAGVEPALLPTLRSSTRGNRDAAGCPAPLVHAAALMQQKKYQEAQPILQNLIAEDPSNAALHFAMGYVHQQQGDWDEASDSYENSESLMPGLSDVHSRLAYLFYRSGDDAEGSAGFANGAGGYPQCRGLSLSRTGFLFQRQVFGGRPRLPGIAGS